MKIFDSLGSAFDGETIPDVFTLEGWVLARVDEALAFEVLLDGKPLNCHFHRVPSRDVHQIHPQYAEANPLPGFKARVSLHLWSPGNHSVAVFVRHRGRRHKIGQSRVVLAPGTVGVDAKTAQPESWSAMAQSTARSVFFLHIPKTAGSSLNLVLKVNFAAADTLLHAENSLIGKTPSEVGDLSRYAFISTHLKLETMRRFVDLDRFLSITLLREPTRQLLSHLGWIERLEAPGLEHELQARPVFVQNAVRRLFSLGQAVFLETLEEEERSLFDNCQTRCLLPEDTDQLEKGALAGAMGNLNTLDLVGITEHFYPFLLVLVYKMGWQPPLRAPYTNKQGSLKQPFPGGGQVGRNRLAPDAVRPAPVRPGRDRVRFPFSRPPAGPFGRWAGRPRRLAFAGWLRFHGPDPDCPEKKIPAAIHSMTAQSKTVPPSAQ